MYIGNLNIGNTLLMLGMYEKILFPNTVFNDDSVDPK
jgi:hypothetical protein